MNHDKTTADYPDSEKNILRKSAPSADKNSAHSAERDPQTYAIIGAAMAVHREMGCGFLEAVYQAALEKEFQSRGIPHEREKRLPIHYCGEMIAEYRVDFVCFGRGHCGAEGAAADYWKRGGTSHQLSQGLGFASGALNQLRYPKSSTPEDGL